jgi:hypothetical protein
VPCWGCHQDAIVFLAKYVPTIISSKWNKGSNILSTRCHFLDALSENSPATLKSGYSFRWPVNGFLGLPAWGIWEIWGIGEFLKRYSDFERF